MTAVVVCTSQETMPDGRATGVYASELVDAWNGLVEAGYRPRILSPRGGQVPVEARRPGHRAEDEFFGSEGGRQARASTSTADYQETPGVVFVAGGHGAMLDLSQDRALADLLRRTRSAGGVVAAVCHGVAGLLAGTEKRVEPLVRGLRVTGFSDEEEAAVGMTDRVPWLLSDRLRAAGAEVEVGPAFLPHVVVDGRVVTGQNPASAQDTVVAAVRVAAGGEGLR